MQHNFSRKYSLVIGKPKTVVYTGQVKIDTEDVLNAVEYVTDTRLEDINAVEITDLDITANVTSSSTTAANASGATIKIKNLSKQTLNIICKQNNYVILSAGYEQQEDIGIIFTGQVMDYRTERSGSDLITTLVCKDGYTPSNGIRVARKWAAGGLTYARLIRDLAGIYADNGVPLGYIIDQGVESNFRQDYVQLPPPDTTPLANGFSAFGFLHQILTNVCSSIGYVWYITNGKLFIHPKGYTKVVEKITIPELNIKSVRPQGSQTGSTSTGKASTGITLTTFLDYRLASDKFISITSGEYSGDYKIDSVSHSLDSRFGEWSTKLVCRLLN